MSDLLCYGLGGAAGFALAAGLLALAATASRGRLVPPQLAPLARRLGLAPKEGPARKARRETGAAA